MTDLYRLLSEVNPNTLNAVLTVIEGPDFGDKCLLSAGVLKWESREDGFFARHPDIMNHVDKSGTLQIGGQRVFCEVLGREKKFVICGGGHISIPLIRMGRMLGCPVTVLEDRPGFAANARCAGATTVICDSFEKRLAGIEGDSDTFIVRQKRNKRTKAPDISFRRCPVPCLRGSAAGEKPPYGNRLLTAA